MPTYLTPGVYFEKPRVQEALTPQRTDIAGFVGLAERGPLHVPQRLTTWRQFQQRYGGFLPYSYLAYAVRAFFENGGRVCWVVRVADVDTAQLAQVKILDDAGRTAYQVRALDPGTWGQELAVSVQSANLAASQHVVIAGLPDDQLAVASIAGFETGSWVRLTQAVGASTVQITRRVQKVDVIRGTLHFDEPLAGSGLHPEDGDHPISAESQEFTLLVWQADQIVERFDGVAPDSQHSRFALDTVNESSRLIRLAQDGGDFLPQMPWRGQLVGGANGLRTLNLFDYIGTPQGDVYGLAALAEIDEVSLLAMPDLTIRPQAPPPSRRAPHRSIEECALDTPTTRITVQGVVKDAETEQPLAGVAVRANDGLAVHTTETAGDGSFVLPDLLPGNIELVFNLTGYLEVARRVAAADVGDVLLSPLDLPPAFSDGDIYQGQMALVAQCEKLRDRFALVDPPLGADGDLLPVDGLQAWRARFDTAFAALYYPWLQVRDPLQPSAPEGRLVPPSGHVAGIYATTDLESGVFRPPANRALSFVEDVGTAIDDALHGLLNPLGINAIRAFPGRGIRIFGARTLSSNSAWRFVNVRRLLSMLEEALYDGLQWAVFEPNDTQLQMGLRLAITALLDSLWRQGAFAGDTAEAAYTVRCDDVTTPPALRAQGQIIAEIGVAPTIPYEFIVLRLGLTTDELQISEI